MNTEQEVVYFYCWGLENLTIHYDKCLKISGDYVEK
jgi:hypothetical protein